MKKIMTIPFVFIILFLSISFINKANATQQTVQNDGTIIVKIASHRIDPDEYDPSKKDISDADKSAIKTRAGTILGWLRNISVIVAVLTIMIVGVKYILGSVEEKAKYKETLVPIVIGVVMASSGAIIVSLIYSSF